MLRRFPFRALGACVTTLAFVFVQLAPASAWEAPDGDINLLAPDVVSASCVADGSKPVGPLSVAQVTQTSPAPSASPSPDESASASPSASPSATPPPISTAPPGAQLLTIPTLAPTGPVATIPPLPTPTPAPTGTKAPALLQRGSPEPDRTVIPKGSPTPKPSATPSGVPTLRPGEVAIISDKVSGVYEKKQPADFEGNVHVFFSDEIAIGDKAHYDGDHTITLTGNPYIINQAGDTILRGDIITVNTDTSIATLIHGRGETTQGVDVGKLHYTADKMTSDKAGKSHGDKAYITTCENPHAGYHITGRTVDVTPGDKMVIRKAVVFLGGLAVFYLPILIIPLKQRPEGAGNQRVLPEIGYNQYEGYYVKARIGFGKDIYYYGIYRIDYRTKLGLGLGYEGNLARKSGHRRNTISFYESKTAQNGPINYNLRATDDERFSNTLTSNLTFGYNGNYGPGIFLPAQETISASVNHTGLRGSQSYTFSDAIQGKQSQSQYGFTDQINFSQTFSQGVLIGYSDYITPSATAGQAATVDTNLHLQTQTHVTTRSADIDLTIDKTDSSTPSTLSKEPELTIRPHPLTHFKIPYNLQFQYGLYSEPQSNIALNGVAQPLTTTRGEVNLTIGQGITYRVLGSTISGSLQVIQDAYGTGDLKAEVLQNAALTTPIGKHFFNSLNYTETNYAGPPNLPFRSLDIRSATNSKSAQEALHVFNNGVYDVLISTGTSFNEQAQPVSYQITTRPSPRSFLTLGGTFVPRGNGGTGFEQTNFQLLTPFGRDTDLQATGLIDWQNKMRIENKVVYLTHTFGQCYDVRLTYNQTLKLVNIAVEILAFPNRAIRYDITKNAPITPQSFSF